MLARRRSTQSPDLLKPFAMSALWNHRQQTCRKRRTSITARLTLEEDVFHIVLDDRIRLVRLPQETGAVLYFQLRVCDFVPDDRSQIVETESPAMFLDARMQRE